MANYEFTVISNWFKVKNPSEFLDTIQKLGYEGSYYDTSNDKVCIASYEQCWDNEHIVIIDNNTGNVIDTVQDCDLVGYFDYGNNINLDKYIQNQLLDNEYVAVKETGNEKLRYNVGCAEVITKNNTKWFCLDNIIEEYIRKELNN